MHLSGFECHAYVHSAKTVHAHSKKGTVVGYDDHSPAYLVFHTDSDVSEKEDALHLLTRTLGYMYYRSMKTISHHPSHQKETLYLMK